MRALRVGTSVLLGLGFSLAISGCLRLEDQPCPEGGQQCPTGYACRSGSCQPVGLDGVLVVVRPGLGEGVQPRAVERVVFESYRDDRLGCWLFRDPDDLDRFAQLEPNVSAEVALDTENPLRMPAGRHVVLVRARDADGEVVAQACQVQDRGEGAEYTLWTTLIRANGVCGDDVVDFGEQCDDGADGSPRCTSDCASIPIELFARDTRCLRDPSVVCTSGPDDDGRCLVSWVVGDDAGDDRLVVAVRHLDGRRDDEPDRGLSLERPSIRQSRLTVDGEQAVVVWVEREDGLDGASFNYVGQETGVTFAIDAPEGDADPAVVLARYVTLADERALLAGWVSSSGSVVLRQPASGEEWTPSLPGTPGDDLTAAIIGGGLVASWSEETTPGDPASADVVATWLSLTDGPLGETVVVPDTVENGQVAPHVVNAGDNRAFFVWTDANNAIDEGDRSGTGIRGRRLWLDGADGSVTVNTNQDRDQTDARVFAGDDFLVATWHDESTAGLRLRYLSPSGAPLPHPFGDGDDAEFDLGDSDAAGAPAVAFGERVVVVWVEEPGDCAVGGRRVQMRLFPAPLR